MEQTLVDYLRQNRCEGFKPVPHYVQSGDYLTLYFTDRRCHAQRVDDLLTVFVSDDDGQLAGCKIKGVRQILEKAKSFGVHLANGNFKLGFLFYLVSRAAKEEVQKNRYYQLQDLLKNEPFDCSLIEACAPGIDGATFPLYTQSVP